MLVSENYDEDIIYLARMAPTRWFRGSEAFGITEAPTRFGRVNFTMSKTTAGQAGLAGNASLRLRPGMASPTIALRLSSGVTGQAFKCVRVDGARGDDCFFMDLMANGITNEDPELNDVIKSLSEATPSSEQNPGPQPLTTTPNHNP